MSVLDFVKVSVWCFFGGAKEVRGGAPAAMRPRRRGTFPDERLPQQVRRLAGVFLDQLSAGRWRATSPESASFANQQMVSLRIAGAGSLPAQAVTWSIFTYLRQSAAPVLLVYTIMTTLRH